MKASFVTKEARFIEAKNMAQTSNLYRLSLVRTKLKPKKAEGNILAICSEKSVDERVIVTFEELKIEGEIDVENVPLPQNGSVPYISLPSGKGISYEKQVNTVDLSVSPYRWIALQPILVPP